MKAIQIRYLAATNTQGVRLKAFTDAGALIEPRDYSINLEKQAFSLAEKYIVDKEWDVDMSGMGTLQNGDYVITLGAN